MAEPDETAASPGKAELAVAFVRKLRALARPEEGAPADKAFFDHLNGEGDTGASATEAQHS